MNDRKYFIGKVGDYAQKKDWFFGHFMEEDLLRSNLVVNYGRRLGNGKVEFLALLSGH